ncbi:MAG: DUF4389 domain-containing protein [Zetaproteobacteria bacterium CG06_land_8_20_14_3_00_59_53]|nr:MAG: hypothetical protein AUK36_05290 [Zetaproteobacteria bacterium CG2_30_59_37]PIO90475.1 MAG: hypothetical protein COX56_01600 [Zetaproteobacteria bacterium CG23_combo_of_CG06-09_8_20_14_all_59_86]PIQ65946.1 MAG: hypothetical protein COV97_01160 [Zetaproteobacteria bacterium CG11_big_fil_rev_8_21_14_0_20_59_439]PIU71426.1 MAG: DUF4389 domain-containing protein [Zetaproteobacteria bacterium CG06_land_8_20_14_3_00_59_53]PIU97682.1 MAG: DUF4389 domain-containing protein [Zetaproteobacteria b
MDNANNLKENLQDGASWMRLLFMLLFAVIYSVAEVVLAMVVVFQFLCVLATGRKNAQVLALGAQLSTFIYQVLRYLTYNSDERPYPLSDWPVEVPAARVADEVTEASEAAAPAKAEPKKAVAKRKPATRKATPRARKKADEGSGPANTN